MESPCVQHPVDAISDATMNRIAQHAGNYA
jgi:hypothetical protein